MAGDLFTKEGTIATLESSGGSLTTGTAVAAATLLDLRAGGTSGALQNLYFQCEFVCQWATVTGIVKDTVAAELYLLASLDGTNYPDVDTTGGSSALSDVGYLGNFKCIKAPAANVNMRINSPFFFRPPFLYKPYILNRSGQTISSTWTLKVMSARGQYT
jgi:hypothetical protein